MKKYIALAAAILGFSYAVNAQDTNTVESLRAEFGLSSAAAEDRFDAGLMSNVVVTAKEKALEAMGSSDESKYRVAIARIERFSDAVAVERSLPADKKPAIKETLEKLSVMAEALAGRFPDVVDKKSVRIAQLSRDTSTGTVYGIDIAEARGMVISQFRGDLDEDSLLTKKLTQLTKRLKDQIAQLAQK